MQQLGFMMSKSQFTIYSPEYTNIGGFLVFKAGGPNGTCNTPNTMWNILYHSNNHSNSI